MRAMIVLLVVAVSLLTPAHRAALLAESDQLTRDGAPR